MKRKRRKRLDKWLKGMSKHKKARLLAALLEDAASRNGHVDFCIDDPDGRPVAKFSLNGE
jgi:hypothetical protein